MLAYFTRNPQAADTVEGIARWRLLDQLVHRTVSETQQAIERLVRDGFLEELSAPGLRRAFRLRPEKAEEARRMVGPTARKARG